MQWTHFLVGVCRLQDLYPALQRQVNANKAGRETKLSPSVMGKTIAITPMRKRVMHFESAGMMAAGCSKQKV